MSVIFVALLILMSGSFSELRSENTTDASQSMAGFCMKYPRPEYQELKRIKYEEDWFELYSVAEGVTAIYEPHQWQEVISYLIEGDKSALLFDTGNGIGDIKSVVAQLTDKPVMVLNSHGHFDHVGGNYQFERIIALDTDYSHQRQTGQSNEVVSMEVSKAALCRPAPNGITELNHVGHPYAISEFIKDGHIIDLGGRELAVLVVPGHTPDAIVLLDRETGLMWTGDSYYSGPIWLFVPETDLTAYRRSLQRMIDVSKGMKFLLPAHNIPLVDPEILPEVLLAFDAMLAGKAQRVEQGDGMVEYRLAGENRFSFLMRDEPLPY